MLISTDFIKAQPVMLPNWEHLSLYLVGCGGTGSKLAPSLVQLARHLILGGKNVSLTFIDPDKVEEKNIFRQQYCQAEEGANKAQALAFRFGTAWGVPVEAIAAPFSSKIIERSYRQLTIICGCVDGAAGRGAIAEALTRHSTSVIYPTQIWWLDCGNHNISGQVLFGSHNEPCDWFDSAGLCAALPSPALQHPELLKEKPEEIGANLSCAEIQQRNFQSFAVNSQVAAIAADYLARLLLGKNLNRFATYFDLDCGSMRSRYITSESLRSEGVETCV